MAAVIREDDVEVSCVVIPLRKTSVLLPNVSVAEILPWRRIRDRQGVPGWYLGDLNWRGESVPVVRFERFHSDEPANPIGRCVIVMNRTRASSAHEFYALVADGLPRMLQVCGSDLADPEACELAAERLRVRLGAEQTVIPDLEFIEDAIERANRAL